LWHMGTTRFDHRAIHGNFIVWVHPLTQMR
jgi:hypothetical protein